MRRCKKPEKATKKEPWLDGPKALVISTVVTASVELINEGILKSSGYIYSGKLAKLLGE